MSKGKTGGRITWGLIMAGACALSLTADAAESARLNDAGSGGEGVEIVGQQNIPVKFENAAGAPLVITKATAQKAADGNSSTLSITVSNQTSRRIVQYALTIEVRSKLATYSEPPSVVEPNATETTNALVLTGDTGDVLIKVTGILFQDGGMWGEFLPRDMSDPKSPVSSPKPPQSSPKPQQSAPQAPAQVSAPSSEATGQMPAPGSVRRELPVAIRNAEGAPLVVTKVKAQVTEQNGAQGAGGKPTTFVDIMVSNTTGRRIVRYAFTIKTPKRVAVYREQVEAIAPQGADSIGPLMLTSDTKDMLVEVVGVQFEDGTVWGAFDPPARS